MIASLGLTRRETLLFGAAALASSLACNVEAAQDLEQHGISAFGDLKYPPEFKHLDYVNPDAPKGGAFSHVGATRVFNQNFLTLQFAQQLHPQGRRRAGHAAHLREPDGARQ
jgi:hypothetical protein